MILRYSVLLLMLMSAMPKQLVAQEWDFPNYSNGFIYSDSALGKLRHVVDSLNNGFRQCEGSRTYYSIEQSLGNYVYVKGEAYADALEDLRRGITYKRFKTKYTGKATFDEDLLFIRYPITTYRSRHFTYLGAVHSYSETKTYLYEDSLWIDDHDNMGKWVGKADNNELILFYMQQDFASTAISTPYGRLIQYSDCMIDTNSSVYAKGAYRSGGLEDWDSPEVSQAGTALCTYMNQTVKKLRAKPDSDSLISANAEFWENEKSGQLSLVDWNADSTFRKLLINAIDDVSTGKTVGYELENYAEKYIGKAALLKLKRVWIKVGTCSEDQAPRVHAMTIATLAAETYNWEVFLRAHLDILNDRFERVIDGSYAQPGRQTYMGELEALNLNVPEMLLGTCFNMTNPSEGHYFGDLGRIARALSKAKNKQNFETIIMSAIRDTRLDLYNRYGMVSLFKTYVAYTKDKKRKAELKADLQRCIETLPHCLSSRFSLKDLN
jgi:hypothetical protein